MEVLDTCYFCTSTFQLFAIISLAIERNEKADLYLDPQFKDPEIYAERLKQTNLFNRVHVIDSSSVYEHYFREEKGRYYKLFRHLDIAKSYLFVNQMAKMIIPFDVIYKNIFVSTKAYMPRMVVLSYIKRKIDFNLFHFDDGVGSYLGDSAYLPNKKDQIIRKYLFGKQANKISYERYLFSPEMFSAVNPDSSVVVHRINPFWNNEKHADLLDQIYAIDVDVCFKEKAVVLDQPLEELSAEQRSLLESALDEAANIIGKEYCVIKKHPRSLGVEYNNFKCFPGFGIPFEIYCMKNEMNNKILISYFSTAFLTPKMLLNQEPYVIPLYRIVNDGNRKDDLCEQYLSALKDSYSDRDKVMIPESMDELRFDLQRILNNTQEK